MELIKNNGVPVLLNFIIWGIKKDSSDLKKS